MIIGSRKYKTDIQYNVQKKKNKRAINDVQNITEKTNDRAMRTPLKSGLTSVTPEG